MSLSRYQAMLPSNSLDHYDQEPIGNGTRMVVFKARAGNAVIRVPLRSEEELVANSGEYKNGVSVLTHEEIEQYEKMEEHLGASLVPVSPFYSYDANGNLRTYSTQRFVRVKKDLRIINTWDPIENTTRDSLAELIHGVRKLIKACGLIPDLAGQNNVVLDARNKAKLIDVNNINTLLDRNSWSNYSDAELREKWHEVLSRHGVKRFINPKYLDDKNYPVADVSLLVMRNWEMILGKRDAELDQDEIYGLIAYGTRRERLLSFFLHPDL